MTRLKVYISNDEDRDPASLKGYAFVIHRGVGMNDLVALGLEADLATCLARANEAVVTAFAEEALR